MHRLTFDYLARASNITKGGVLYHFKSKSHLLHQMNQMVITKFEDILDSYTLQALPYLHVLMPTLHWIF